MDFEYGFGISIALVGAAVAAWAITDAIRRKENYGRYVLVFLAGFCDLLAALVRLIAIATARPTETVNGVFTSYYPFQAVHAAAFFLSLSTIIQQYFFFEICRTIISSQVAAVPLTPSKRRLKLTATYLAIIWNVLLVIIDIAFRAVLSSHGYFVTVGSNSLYFFSAYAVWGYIAFAMTQIGMGYQELRPCVKSLGVYFAFMLIVSIGKTATAVISMRIGYDLTGPILELVMVNIAGLFGLFYALWALPRYWIPKPEWYKPSNQQPYYNAQAPMMGIPQQQPIPAPPPMLATTTGPPSQSQQPPMPTPQYPVVQLPQQQLQSGQYPIVQIPLSQQQSGQQYPIVQVQYSPNPPPTTQQ